MFSRAFLFILLLAFVAMASPSQAADNYPYAVVQVLDKITTARQRVAIPVGKSMAIGTLRIGVRTCQKSSPEEKPEVIAFLEIYDLKQEEDKKKPIFTGWMFKSSPSLSTLEHAVYDVTVVDCSSASTKSN